MNSMMKTLKIAYKVVDYLEKYLIANAERKIVLTNQRQKMKKVFRCHTCRNNKFIRIGPLFIDLS